MKLYTAKVKETIFFTYEAFARSEKEFKTFIGQDCSRLERKISSSQIEVLEIEAETAQASMEREIKEAIKSHDPYYDSSDSLCGSILGIIDRYKATNETS